MKGYRSRRQFLKEVGASVSAVAVAGCGAEDPATTDAALAADTGEGAQDTGAAGDTGPAGDALVPDELEEYAYDGEPGPEDLFRHGVASGDPLPDGVILWTRVTQPGEAPVEVWWEIALDPAFLSRVAVGTVQSTPARDFTAKVDVPGLDAGRAYYYRFASLGRWSPIGRTRTAPTGAVSQLRLAVCACSNYSKGWFLSYRKIAKMPDLDAVIHLGDYFYEGGEAGFVPERAHDPSHELVSLKDYRTRYAQYRTDPDLAEAHRQHPWISVWDDHEISNDAWHGGAGNHQPQDGPWEVRKAAAQQAYEEWMPIRVDDPNRIFRTLKFGDLADLILLDTRLYGRDQQTKDEAEMNDPDRTMLGDEQEAWVEAQLSQSTATWRVLAQQVVMAPVTAAGVTLNPDQWDGYKPAQQRMLALLGASADTVVLTGDIHSSWAADMPLDPATYDRETGAGSVAVEFVAPGVTSGFPLDPSLGQLAIDFNPHIHYAEVSRRGHFTLDVTPERVQASWTHWELITDTNSAELQGGIFSAALGTRHLTADEVAAQPGGHVPAPAP